MTDIPYRHASIPEAARPFFEQLTAVFQEYEVWARLEDFGRWISAGVVNPTTGVAATFVVLRAGRVRTAPLSDREIARVRQHLATAGHEDLNVEDNAK